MLGISWNEYLIIAVVALIVIGPKELPRVLRALGQWTAQIRRMAAEFQGQFREALREAEMSDLNRNVNDLSLQDIMKQWEPKPEPAPDKADAAAAPAAAAPGVAAADAVAGERVGDSVAAEHVAAEQVAAEHVPGEAAAAGPAEHGAATSASPAPSEPAAAEAGGMKG